MALEFGLHGWRGHHDAARRAMKAPQHGVSEGLRHAVLGLEIFGKPRVKGRRKGQLAPQTIPTPFDAERSLGGDMHRIWCKSIQHVGDLAADAISEPDLGIARAGDGGKQIGTDHQDIVPHGAQFGGQVRERADDAIHLRMPGIRDDCDLHL